MAISRLLSLINEGGPGSRRLSDLILGAPRHAHVVGVTGSPGAGKSSLVAALVERLHTRGRVGVLAVDPTSPLTGGALLGDRIRMKNFTANRNVFMRSLSSKGGTGGLAERTAEAVDLLESVGMDWVVVETVGIGQVEVDISRTADSTVVVLTPESGDVIQAAKAGLNEVADIFVINKADRPGAKELRRDVLRMNRRPAPEAWNPPVIETIATEQVGLDNLETALTQHRQYLQDSGVGTERRHARTSSTLQANLLRELTQVAGDVLRDDAGTAIVRAVAAGQLSTDRANKELRRLVEARWTRDA